MANGYLQGEDIVKGIKQAFSIEGLKNAFMAGTVLVITYAVIMVIVGGILGFTLLGSMNGGSGTPLTGLQNIMGSITKVLIAGIIVVVLSVIVYLIGDIVYQGIIWKSIKKASENKETSIKTAGIRAFVAKLLIFLVALPLYGIGVVIMAVLAAVGGNGGSDGLGALAIVEFLFAIIYFAPLTLVFIAFSVRYAARVIESIEKSTLSLLIQEFKAALSLKGIMYSIVYLIVAVIMTIGVFIPETITQLIFGTIAGLIGGKLGGFIVNTVIGIYFNTFLLLVMYGIAYNSIMTIKKAKQKENGK